MLNAAGEWDAWGLGDKGPIVKAAKLKLQAKFGYAKGLDDSEYFDEALKFVLATYQTRKNMDGYVPPLRMDGALDWRTQIALGITAGPAKLKPVLFTVHGTGVSMVDGYPADLARRLLDVVTWQPIGNYPAAAFPMRPSIEAGVKELRLQIRSYATRLPGIKMMLAGYSQGAVVTSWVWKHDIINPNGELYDLRDQFIGSVTWGNPAREKGVANGNRFIGQPVSATDRGILDDRLENTPAWWYDFAHDGISPFGRDIYTATPDNNAGADMTAIWKIVERLEFTALFARLGVILKNPTVELAAAAHAVLYAGAFFAANPPTLPHVNYEIDGAAAVLRKIATP